MLMVLLFVANIRHHRSYFSGLFFIFVQGVIQ